MKSELSSHPESFELVRNFYRKWSILELNEHSRPLLKEDVISIRVLLDMNEQPKHVVEDAEFAPDRFWFAKRYKDVFLTSKS